MKGCLLLRTISFVELVQFPSRQQLADVYLLINVVILLPLLFKLGTLFKFTDQIDFKYCNMLVFHTLCRMETQA